MSIPSPEGSDTIRQGIAQQFKAIIIASPLGVGVNEENQ